MAILVDGRVRRSEREHRDLAWLAYTTAALSRAKKLPDAKTFLGAPEKTKPKHMSADQLLAMARMWSAVAPPKT